MSQNEKHLRQMLPESISGWVIPAKDQFFDRNNLYDYIDGGAELYLSYGFRNALNRTYTQENQPDILVDIFDMGEARNAFGVFSHSREKVEKEVGQGSISSPGMLMFWKDRYFVSILASPETAQSRKAMYQIADTIANSIRNEGELPKILNLLPGEKLAAESVRYFRHYVWLNSFYFISDENLLKINEDTDAVLAKYDSMEQKRILLIVEYPDETMAAAARVSFTNGFLSDLAVRNTARLEDGSWMAFRQINNHLVAVFRAGTESEAKDLLENTAANINHLKYK